MRIVSILSPLLSIEINNLFDYVVNIMNLVHYDNF
jgi:hypothetical protein